MTEDQYIELCEACDTVLLAEDSTLERVAIPWLHVIREHPDVLAKYNDVFEPVNAAKKIVQRAWQVFRSKIYWIKQIKGFLLSRGKFWYGPEDFSRTIDVLFVSHLINENQAGKHQDFYFAGLADDLIANGFSVAIAMINHTGKYAKPMIQKWDGSLVTRIIFSESLPISQELELRRRLKVESYHLNQCAKIGKNGFTRRIFTRASEEVVTGGTLSILRLNLQINTLVKKLQPNAIVITHEGHSWERIAFTAARNAQPHIRCFGYQHSALFRLQHSIRRNLAPQFNPDQILTSGIISKNQLKNSRDLKDIPISVLGTNRAILDDHSKVEDQHSISRSGKIENAWCLVLPEGFVSECYYLFEFSLACALKNPEINFLWRLHPLVSFKSLMLNNPKLRNLPRNIELSFATLKEDIARCRWALYRGTTAIVQAVGAGLRPLYLQLPGEMSIDPFYDLKDWRVTVRSVSEFQNIITADSNCTVDVLKSEAMNAKKYCNDFFVPLNSKILIDSLKSITSSLRDIDNT